MGGHRPLLGGVAGQFMAGCGGHDGEGVKERDRGNRSFFWPAAFGRASLHNLTMMRAQILYAS